MAVARTCKRGLELMMASEDRLLRAGTCLRLGTLVAAGRVLVGVLEVGVLWW